MYHAPFLLAKPTGNNAFGYEKRINKALFVPSLVEGTFEDVQEDIEHTVFAVENEAGAIEEKHGLQHFVKTTWNQVETVVVDNHNHVFYFWLEAQKRGIFDQNTTLIHIDEHSDMRVPEYFLSAKEAEHAPSVFAYTNEVLNVGNYIVPALHLGVFEGVENIGSSYDLELWKQKELPKSYVLNIDLDFWSPELDFMDTQEKFALTKRLAKQAKYITIATSPFFIEQKKALQILQELVN